MRRGQRGFSLIESMAAIAIATVVMGAFMPKLTTIMRTYRRDGVMERIVGDVRKARAQAITTGWQYRVVGFNAGGTSPYKNQYRIMARRSSAVAWPGDTVAPMQSTTQMAGNFVDIRTMYPGVSLNPSDTSLDFAVAFDSRGVRIELDSSFTPLLVSSQTGSTRSIAVSAVGNVTMP